MHQNHMSSVSYSTHLRMYDDEQLVIALNDCCEDADSEDGDSEEFCIPFSWIEDFALAKKEIDAMRQTNRRNWGK